MPFEVTDESKVSTSEIMKNRKYTQKFRARKDPASKVSLEMFTVMMEKISRLKEMRREIIAQKSGAFTKLATEFKKAQRALERKYQKDVAALEGQNDDDLVALEKDLYNFENALKCFYGTNEFNAMAAEYNRKHKADEKPDGGVTDGVSEKVGEE